MEFADLLPYFATGGVSWLGSYLMATKKSKQELKALEESNKHEIEKLMKQHEIDIEALKEKHIMEMEKGESEHKHKLEIIEKEAMNSAMLELFKNPEKLGELENNPSIKKFSK